MKLLNAFIMSLSTFCSIPCPVKTWDEDARPYMTLMLPLVGTWIGLLWSSAAVLLKTLGISVLIWAALLTLFHFKITGFIHADGFMDCSDALLSERDIDGRRKILKDPCCGSFAVISLVLLILTEFAALASVGNIPAEINAAPDSFFPGTYKGIGFPWIFIPVTVISRALSGFYITVLKPLPGSQYSGAYRNMLNKKHAAIYIFYILACFAVCILLKSAEGAVIFVVEIIVHSAAVYTAYKSLDGMNGDVSGYAISLSECGALVVMAVI